MYKITYGELLRRVPVALQMLQAPRLKVLYLHGLGANWSKKASAIRSAGYVVQSPRLPGDWTSILAAKIPFLFQDKKKKNWDSACKIAAKAIDEFEPDLIVGSSMGGAITMNVNHNIPQILIAPAWKVFGVSPKVSNNCTIFHGDEDTLVPLTDSKKLVDLNPGTKLEVVDDDHRVNKHLPKVLNAIENYANVLGKPTPKPVRIKNFNAIIRPSGIMEIKKPGQKYSEWIIKDDDEIFVDEKAGLFHKVPKPVQFFPQTKLVWPNEETLKNYW